MSLKEKFDMAVDVVQSLPKEGPQQPSDQVRLKFYSYYKQATVGKCNTSGPGMFSLDLVGKAKWNAWNGLGDMSSEEAMANYVMELKKMIQENPGKTEDAVQAKIDKFMSMV